MPTLEQQRDAIEAIRDRLHELARHHAKMTILKARDELVEILDIAARLDLDDDARQRLGVLFDAARRAHTVTPTVFVSYLECVRWELLSRQMDLYNQIRKLDPSYE